MTMTKSSGLATEKFTRADYALLPEEFRAFLLDGQFVREPAPTFGHQTIVLAIAIRAHAAAPRRTLIAPADIVIDDWNVLQPDVLIFGEHVRHAAQADPEEVPVLVVEVLSPSTARRDRESKTAAYLRAGVAEVWLVDPTARSIDVVTGNGLRHHASDQPAISAVVGEFALTADELVAS